MTLQRLAQSGANHDEMALLAACLQASALDDHDLAPFLVYADWLEEHDADATARLIRQGVEQAEYDPFYDFPRIENSETFREARHCWQRLLPPARSQSADLVTWRGLPTVLRLDLRNEPIDTLRDWLVDVPLVRHLQLWNTRVDHLETLLDSPIASGLHSLRISGESLQAADMGRLLEGNPFPQLSWLAWGRTRMTADTADRVAACTWRSQLTRLNLPLLRETPPEHLSAWFTNLGPSIRWRRLSLSVTSLSGEPIQRLTRLDLPAISHLDLSNTQIGENDLAQLALAPWARQLEVLSLANNTAIDDHALRSLIQDGDFPRLRTLDLSFTNVSDSILPQLFHSDFPELSTIDLRSTGISRGGEKFVRHSLGYRGRTHFVPNPSASRRA